MIEASREPCWHYEDQALKRGHSLVCGIDEAGRGSLAGPVVAASVILDRQKRWEGIRDSKLLTYRARRMFFGKILEGALSWGIGVVDAGSVDRMNVLNATIAAMRAAISSMNIVPDFILIDSVRISPLPSPSLSITGGDRVSYSIAAASILAKVYRDSLMEKIHELFPRYNFYRNKGYGTKEHREALSSFGPCSIHRRSFKGVSSFHMQ